MRLLFVTHYALPHIGGIEAAVDALAEELASRGHDVAHLASAAGGPPALARPRRYRVIRIPAVNVAERRLGVPYPLFSPRLGSALRREVARADVVHAHGFLSMSSVAALTYARRRSPGHPVRVLTEHVGHVAYDNPLLDRTERLAIATLGRLAARSAQVIVTLNSKVHAEMTALAPDRRVLRVPNGVDSERYSPPRANERATLRRRFNWDERPRVLFVGRPVAKKGLHVALAAAAAARSFVLVVVGYTSLPPGAPPNVELLGQLEPRRVADVYRACDALIAPSRGEGFPLAVSEAMSSGLPVVLSDDPSYSDLLIGAEPGVCLLPPDGTTMAAALDELLEDSERARRAGSAAAEYARRHFSWRRAADQHVALYEGLRG